MSRVFSVSLILFILSFSVSASDDPVDVRHEMMEGVLDGAKAIGDMLKEKREFDAAVAMDALLVWQKASKEFGDLFPEGSYTGGEDKAKETVWTDREGFNKLLADFAREVDAAVAAEPQDLEALNAAAGPIFKVCKKCHEGYRIEGD
ncbi:c-type cytochrome [Pseudomonadota bacterium]